MVRDSSGAVIPGVTVEASSPALIEKVRSVVSDAQGQYRIVDLRPGVYAVTFSLPGFTSVRRDGVELPANFTATINAELRVGALEETVTVSGASPVVDVQNTQPRSIITSDTLDTLPTAGKALTAFVALIPGLAVPANAQDVGGNKGELSVRVSIHGGRANQMRWLQDGMEVTSSDGAGSGHGFYPNPASTEEVSVDLGGGPGEANVGAVQLNYVPKTGGNTFSGSVFAAYANEGFQSDNLSPALQSRGLTTVNPIEEVYDYNFTLGGPVLRDRLWFFTAHRIWGNSSKLAGVFENTNPRAMVYEPDPSRQAVSDFTNRGHNLRLTGQLSQRNRLSAVVRSAGQLRLPSRHRERRRQCREHVARGGRPPPLRAEQHLAGDLELSGDQPTAVRGRGDGLHLLVARPARAGRDLRHELDPRAVDQFPLPRGADLHADPEELAGQRARVDVVRHRYAPLQDRPVLASCVAVTIRSRPTASATPPR